MELFLSRERAPVALAVGGLAALAWAWLIPASRDMYGGMQGLAAWMMRGTWDAAYFAQIFLMWAVMMLGMMLPSAAPAILLFARAIRGNGAAGQRVTAFIAGYALAWSAFSLAATVAQWALAQAALLSPMMQLSQPALGSALLVAAGLYQWSAAKAQCLARCRAPFEFITRHFRPGVTGALRLGAQHGLYCVGCCWALMLLLFAGGVMSLAWIGAISLFVLLEKLAPHGAQGGRLSGAVLILLGIAGTIAALR
ncbi:MAG TPA: DUF2182 domain-containing protein [Candidatus Binatia bacterium]|nr:DUF2182 domain-containing protein [Candidatus Binatia bacterium]